MFLGSWPRTRGVLASRHVPDAREHTLALTCITTGAGLRTSLLHTSGGGRGGQRRQPKPEEMLEADDPSKPPLQGARIGVNSDLEATNS